MKIKVISLWQPWAWAMWEELKRYETRIASAPVVRQLRTYRGWLGIHAAKKPFNVYDYPAEWLNELRKHWQSVQGNQTSEIQTNEFQQALHYGCLGGIVKFDGGLFQTQSLASKLTPTEIFFGDYTAGRRAIHCPGMIPLDVPIPLRGQQGLFDWEVWPEVEERLKAQTGRV
jgi:hypothetical protein